MQRMMTIWMTASLMLVGIGQASAVPVFMCNDDSQCEEGTVCVDGDCKIPCTSDGDCAEGFGCTSGGDKGEKDPPAESLPCPPADPECEEAKPEPTPPNDGESFCEPLPTSCSSDADCADDEHCAFGPTTGTSSGSAGGVPPSGGTDSGPGAGSDDSGGSDDSDGSDTETEGEATEAPVPGEKGDEGICMPGSGGWESECESDEDCPMGMLCEELGSMGTTISTPNCQCPAGEPDCDCGEGDAAPPEEPEAYYGCVPAPCDTDADCADGLVCVTNTWEECAPTQMEAPPSMQPDCDPEDPDCEPNDDGDDEGMDDSEGFAPEEADCETVTESYCMPPYFAPCEVDDDCGEGFSCVEEEICGCEDSTDEATDAREVQPEIPTDEAEDDDEPVDEDEEEADCSCELTGEMICELKDLPCGSDEDCSIEGWTCQMMPSISTCTFDEETMETICDEPEESEGQCVPPSWGGNGAEMGLADDNATAETSSPEDPTNPDDESGDDDQSPDDGSSAAGGDGSSAAGGDGSAAAGGDGSATDGDVTDGDADDEGGCQGGAPSQGGLMALMLLALAMITRRERVMER